MSHAPAVITQNIPVGKVHIIRLENQLLRVEVSPETGGRITSLFNKHLRQEFLWRNERLILQPVQLGAPYDPNFYGGIDEVIPGDLPEQICGLETSDHGELWTLPLDHRVDGETVVVEGQLPVWGLRYQKRIRLRPGTCWIDLDFHLDNPTGELRYFLWKLHAALAISPGDRLVCPARFAVVADPAWSRWKIQAPFDWPLVNGERADILPPSNGSADFLFLYPLTEGRVSLYRPSTQTQFSIVFDPQVFPYLCYFASYGGLDGHTTAILEPCTAMPVSVNEAIRLNQCSFLVPGASMATHISIYAGPSDPD